MRKSSNAVLALNQVAQDKKEQARNRVETAIVDLLERGEKITVSSIATEANVTRAYIYKYKDLFERISTLREQQLNNPQSQSILVETQRELKAARSLIAKLEAENAKLRSKIVDLKYRPQLKKNIVN